MSHKVIVHTNSDYGHAADALDAATRSTLAHEGAAPGKLSIVLVDEESMRQFNLRFAEVDAATDVLAFTDGSLDPDSGMTYHGDVIICYPIAEHQAALGGHSLSAELNLLAIHGALHLLGYDHDEEESQAAMWAVQDAILKELGCQLTSSEGS
jgi:probable rRNA maturation factor